MEQWTEVPLLAKLLKLLVNEMQNCVEEAENGAEDSSDEEEGWDDDSQDSQEEESGGAALTLDLSRLKIMAYDLKSHFYRGQMLN